MAKLYRANLAQTLRDLGEPIENTGFGIHGGTGRLALVDHETALVAFGKRVYLVRFTTADSETDDGAPRMEDSSKSFTSFFPFPSLNVEFTGLQLDSTISTIAAVSCTREADSKYLHVVVASELGRILYAEGDCLDCGSWKKYHTQHPGIVEDGLVSCGIFPSKPSLFITTHLFSGRACLWERNKLVDHVNLEGNPSCLTLTALSVDQYVIIIAERDVVSIWDLDMKRLDLTLKKRSNFLGKTTLSSGTIYTVGANPSMFAIGGVETNIQLRHCSNPDELLQRWPTGAKYEVSHVRIPSFGPCAFACGTDNEVLFGEWGEGVNQSPQKRQKIEPTDSSANEGTLRKSSRSKTVVLFRGDSAWAGLDLDETPGGGLGKHARDEKKGFLAALSERGALYVLANIQNLL